MATIQSQARWGKLERLVFVRVGGLEGRLYIDLCDRSWRAIEIDSKGWRIVGDPPVRFRRAAGMLPLPAPVEGGSIDALRPFLNVTSDSDFVLAVAWLLAALRDTGPYPLLALAGEQGTAKSTFATTLRSLVDPNSAPLRSSPREDRDLFIAANNGHVIGFDNMSGISPWLSDAMCRLATGGGWATRQLYSDSNEVLFNAMKPIVLNGIEDVVDRPDLADRMISLTLESIPEERRKTSKELSTALDRERPAILGALLSAVSMGLRNLSSIRLARLPRMADFAQWITACEPALWPAGTFGAAYDANCHKAIQEIVDADPVAAAVNVMLTSKQEWRGTATALLAVLSSAAGATVSRSRDWPSSAKLLSGRLRRVAPALRKVGIEIKFGRESKARIRWIEILRA